jgi:hypothetical protein
MAINLATNILTFVGFAREIIITGHDPTPISPRLELAKKNFESETLAYDIKNKVEKTTFPEVPDESLLLPDDKSLHSLSEQCQVFADKFVRGSAKLRVSEHYKK